jgi:hypothetical protein
MFKNYITNLLTEKGIDLDDTFAIILPRHAHVYEYGQFIEDLVELTDGDTKVREQIRRTFVKIDFVNGDVLDYVKHLATGIVKSAGY